MTSSIQDYSQTRFSDSSTTHFESILYIHPIKIDLTGSWHAPDEDLTVYRGLKGRHTLTTLASLI